MASRRLRWGARMAASGNVCPPASCSWYSGWRRWSGRWRSWRAGVLAWGKPRVARGVGSVSGRAELSALHQSRTARPPPAQDGQGIDVDQQEGPEVHEPHAQDVLADQVEHHCHGDVDPAQARPAKDQDETELPGEGERR